MDRPTLEETEMFTVYAVFPADYEPEQQAVAIFAERSDAEFFIAANEEAERDFRDQLIIEIWDVSNVAFMNAT